VAAIGSRGRKKNEFKRSVVKRTSTFPLTNLKGKVGAGGMSENTSLRIALKARDVPGGRTKKGKATKIS